MALDTFQKTRIRYHFDIAFSGSPFSGVTLGLRTVTRAGNLEYYMANVAPEDEALLLGRPYAAAQVYGPLSLGSTFSVTINGTLVSYSVSAGDLAQPNSLFQTLNNLAQAVNGASLGVVAIATYQSTDKTLPGTAPAYGQIVVTSPKTFTAVFSGPGLIQTGFGTTYAGPSMQVDSGDPANPIIVNGLLPICDTLETSTLSTNDRLAFSQAGAATTGQVTFNRAELKQRQALYKTYVKKMAIALGFSLASYQSRGLY